MRLSCNGCRVLRKGCSSDCSIKPCLQWIKNPQSQSNATLFLAKFYGRAGLTNLINAGPHHLRPAIFKSLLHEACGRIVNPIYGSVGLIWSGRWNICQEAVEAVLQGKPITPVSSESALTGVSHPLNPYEIRHVNKNDTSAGSARLHKVNKPVKQFKVSGKKPKLEIETDEDKSGRVACNTGCVQEFDWLTSRDSVTSENDSVETVEVSLGEATNEGAGYRHVELNLTLGF